MELTPGFVRALCDRHRGIGADGVIRLGATGVDTPADVFMDYRNADGSLAEMCGNGVRTVAKYLADRGIVEGDKVAVDTRGGVKEVICHRGPRGLVASCTVDMGMPQPGEVRATIELPDDGRAQITTLSMGNPHAVIFTDDLEAAPVDTVGPVIETHPLFARGTNVEFVSVGDRRTVAGRIWERGVGETLASGTGASAMAVAAVMNDLTDRRVAVHLPGGVLDVDWTGHTLFVTGPAVEVAAGTIDRDWAADVMRHG